MNGAAAAPPGIPAGELTPTHRADTEVIKGLQTICESGQVYEIRVFNQDGSISSGYDRDLGSLAEQIAVIDSSNTTGIYLTVNPADPALLARRGRIARLNPKDPTTSDNDIIRRRWLPIDLDPKRASGISSTNEEKAAAFDLVSPIVEYLTGLGWPEPVVADSGNGYHILYRIDLPNDPEARELVKGCLGALGKRFDTAVVEVDLKTFNAARIMKVYGTTARKGVSIPERPHRLSHLVRVPGDNVVVTRAQLEALAPPTTPLNQLVKKSSGKAFDLSKWLSKFGENLPCKCIPKTKSGYKYFYILDPCPFSDGAHNDGAYLGQMNSGALDCKCHHNSCGSDNRWSELRAMGDPDFKMKESVEQDETRTRFHRSFIDTGEKIYLTCVDGNGWYSFCHQDNNEVVFMDGVTIDNAPYIPQFLPVKDGQVLNIVGIPTREAIENAPLVTADDLFALITTHIKKYVDAPDLDIEMFVYYIIFTWFYPKTNTVPYLRFLGDTGKGKSRLARTTADLCFYPVIVTGASSTSGIFRTKEKWNGTLKIDENDLQGDMANELIKYFNLGFEKEQYFIKSDKADPKQQDIFDPFGPKIFSMRKPFKDNATEGRCLSFSPHETHNLEIPIILLPVYDTEVVKLRGVITRFVLNQWPNVDGYNMIDCREILIEPRLKQLGMPLSITLQILPGGKERFINYMKKRQDEIKKARSESWEGVIFNTLYGLVLDGKEQAITSRMVSELIGSTPHKITSALESIGFSSESTNIEAKFPKKDKDGKETFVYKRKTVRALKVPSGKSWNEIIQRYYYNDDETTTQTSINEKFGAFWCPEILKSKKYIEDFVKEAIVTDVTTVTLPRVTQDLSLHTTIPQDRVTQDHEKVIGGVTPQSVTSVTSVTEKIAGDPQQQPIRQSVTSVTKPDPEFEKSQQTQQTKSELLQIFDLPADLDISQYTRFSMAGQRCHCKGCTDPGIWHGPNRSTPRSLCGKHYTEIKGGNSK